jgi:gluconate kinase
MIFIPDKNRKKRGQGIVKVSDLFKKYRDTLKAPQGAVVTAFLEVVKELFGVTLKKEHCAYRVSTQTLTLTTSGMLKTEILLKKKVILSKMAEKLGEKSAPREIL